MKNNRRQKNTSEIFKYFSSGFIVEHMEDGIPIYQSKIMPQNRTTEKSPRKLL